MPLHIFRNIRKNQENLLSVFVMLFCSIQKQFLATTKIFGIVRQKRAENFETSLRFILIFVSGQCGAGPNIKLLLNKLSNGVLTVMNI